MTLSRARAVGVYDYSMYCALATLCFSERIICNVPFFFLFLLNDKYLSMFLLRTEGENSTHRGRRTNEIRKKNLSITVDAWHGLGQA